MYQEYRHKQPDPQSEEIEIDSKSFSQSRGKNTIPIIESVPTWWAAQSNRHLYAMLRTVYKCLDVSLVKKW